ncbi:MAG TPA: diguanylate cyclase [Candidatus Sabulitectum sp.]|nr:diguanylate cyclase [Candidatus Sabulitectum sp.]
MRTMKVLIIDDDPASVALARQWLKKDGHGIVTAADGEEGLAMAVREEPDLILLDVHMPGMNGFQVCERLKADSRIRHIPVIFLSAADETREKVKGLDLGAVDYVTKPFDRFELPARVRAALRTKRLQDLLTVYSEIDSLTEVYNRRVLMERLEQEWNRTRRYSTTVAFIMCDIDHFKNVNDTHGHPTGDQVLERIATLLRKSVRSSDMVGRYGGEEFGIIMVNADRASAASAAERYRKKIESMDFHSRRGEFRVTVSFGVADSRGKDSVNQLINAADRALYKAKETGRNTVCVED